jgi:hypothetical protein
VWFAPFPCDLTAAQLRPYFAECAERDEGEQVTYLRDLLEIFEQEGVDTAFWFTFASYDLPYRPGPRDDLDMAAYGVVRVLEQGRGSAYPDMGWEPEASFHALAAAYAG